MAPRGRQSLTPQRAETQQDQDQQERPTTPAALHNQPASKEIAWLKLDKMDGSGAEPEEEWREFYGDLEAMIVVANNFKLAAILNANVNPASAAPGTMFGSFTADDLAAPNVMLAAGLRLCTKGKAKKMVALPAHKNNGWSALAAMKAEWGFTASAKLKRHGLWCTLFGVRCKGDELKDAYVMRVQRLMYDICDSYADKTMPVDAIIADMAEAAMVMGLDPDYDSEMIGNYHSDIDNNNMTKLSKMLIDHDKYRVSVRGRERIEHRLGVANLAEVNYVRGKGGGSAGGKGGGSSSTGQRRSAPPDFHCWTCGDTGHGVWECQSGLPKYQWRDRQGGSAEASAAAATAEQCYQQHREQQSSTAPALEQLYQQHRQQHSGSAVKTEAQTVQELNATLAALALQPQTQTEQASAAVVTDEDRLTDMFRQAGYPSGGTGFAAHVSIETGSDGDAAARAHTVAVAEATGTDPRFLRPMTAAELSMYGCD